MSNFPLRSVIAERLGPFFQASPFYPSRVLEAWDDGKDRMRKSLQSQIAALDELTLDEFCKVTGSNINQDLLDERLARRKPRRLR